MLQAHHCNNIPSPKFINNNALSKNAQISGKIPIKSKTKGSKANKENIFFKGEEKTAPKGEKAVRRPDKENISFDKENISQSPRHKTKHLNVKHKSMMNAEEVIPNFGAQPIEEEISLKSFIKQIMPQKNPALLFNKYLEQLSPSDFKQPGFREEMKAFLQQTKNDRDEEYLNLYGEAMEKQMYENEPDYSNFLASTSITDTLRARMIDWMLEIFSQYPTSSHFTYFKSIAIFHLYLKKCYQTSQKILTDSDIHLTGIASMFLASKYEDESAIPLKDFVSLIGHSTFSMKDIKEREWEIFSALEMNLTFPTCVCFFKFYYYRCFWVEASELSRSLHEISLYILKLCQYSKHLAEIRPHILAFCSIIYGIRLLFSVFQEAKGINLREIENRMFEKMFACQEKISLSEVKDCLEKIQRLVINWTNDFPKIMNIMRPNFMISG